MDGAPLPTDIHTEFLYYLQSDGIRRTNFEGKEFYFPRQISRWLLQKGSNATSSRVVRLFSAIYDNREGFTGKFFPTLKDKDVERDPILFAILVQMECGHMLHIFRNSIADTHLGFHNLSHLYTDIEQALKEDKITLPDRYKTTGYTGVSTDFERRRWAFHPALNVLDMVETGIEGKSILPFFDRDIINEGGTAEVHHHKIHADLVENENLRQILEPRKQDHNTGIEYYDFAVKSYLNGFDDLYKLDSDAFKRFNGTKDPRSLGVVTYLGEYLRHDRTDNGFSQGITRHIMLEFGEQDLDEYLADTYPPVLNEEIIAFWESLFEIAKTLARIHQLEHVRGDKVQKYVGWHGDINPDNILRVRGKFKLANFGFMRFEKSDIGKPQTTHMLGDNRTYGAPEREEPAGEAKRLNSTTIDTWSLGCVFSAVATWVVLGSQGYENYGEMRVMVHKRLRQRHSHDSSVNVSNCSDAFHDGIDVLPAVLNWHEYLRSSSRKTDTITCRVLDLVESGMLDKDPEKRLESAALCTRLDQVLIDAKKEYQDELKVGRLRRQSPETLSALLELDKRAPKSAQPRSQPAIDNNYCSTRKDTASGLFNGSALAVARSSRVKKFEHLNKFLRGKIAHREEVIQSGLDALTGGIFELPTDGRSIPAGGAAAENLSQTLKTTPYTQQSGFHATSIPTIHTTQDREIATTPSELPQDPEDHWNSSATSRTAIHLSASQGEDHVSTTGKEMPLAPPNEKDLAGRMKTFLNSINRTKGAKSSRHESPKAEPRFASRQEPRQELGLQRPRIGDPWLEGYRLNPTKDNTSQLDSSQQDGLMSDENNPDDPQDNDRQLNKNSSQCVDVYYVLQPLWHASSIVTDAWKRGIETVGGTQLSWWPLADPERVPKPGFTRIYSVVFSEARLTTQRFYDDIPTSSAQRIFPRLSNSCYFPLPTGLQALGRQAVILRETTLMQVLHQFQSRGDYRTSLVPESAYPQRADVQLGTGITPWGVNGTYGKAERFAGDDQRSDQRGAEASSEAVGQEIKRSKVVLYLTANIGREESVACAVELGNNDQETLRSLRTAFRSFPSSRWKIATGVRFYRFRSFHFRQQSNRCSVVVHEDKERYPREVDPEYKSYQYTPRPWEDDHELPCLSGEAWYFYNNQDECRTSKQLNGSFPTRLGESPGSRFTGWSIHIQQRYSILIILIPVLAVTVITLVSTMWFIPAWLRTHEDDLQNATVPVMLALTTVQFMIQLLVSLLVFRWSL